MKKLTFVFLFILIIISQVAYAGNQRPFIVMIDNHKDARPQYGLGSANIVYEALAEGGIPRYMAVFINKTVKKIGPVRSAREYFVKLASPYKGLYSHCGGSLYAYIAIKKLNICDLDQLKHEGYFWRDKNKKQPHNLFTSTLLLKKSLQKIKVQSSNISYFGAEIKTYKDKSKPINKIVIKYNPSYMVTYMYDKEKNGYNRYINGQKDIDALANTQIFAKNIIILRVYTHVRKNDKEGRLIVKLEGMGTGMVLSGGKLTPVRWVKHKKEPIFLMDKSGSKITLNPGNIWVEIVPKENAQLFYK